MSMNSEKYKILELKYDSIGVPIHYFLRDGTLLFVCPKIIRGADPLCTDPSIVNEFIDSLNNRDNKDNLPIIKITKYGLFYAAIPCSENDGSFLVLGPAPSIAITDISIAQIAADHSITEVEIFSDLLFCSNRISFKQFSSMCSLEYFYEWGKLPDMNKLCQNYNAMPITNYMFDGFLVDFLFKERENVPLRVSQEGKHKLLRYITEGDCRTACRYLKHALENISEFSTDSNKLEQSRNAFIAITSIIAQAVCDAGMDSKIAWFIWNLYVSKASAAQNVYSVNKLYAVMVCDFSERALIDKNHYSNPIQKCCDYILDNLHNKITLKELAAVAGLSQHYFSEKFNSETGMTVTNFIQAERIREAKNLLSFSNYNLAEISCYLNFSSQSYFSAVFRKHTGMTPQGYRDKYNVQ